MLEGQYMTFGEAIIFTNLSRASLERFINDAKYHHGDPFPMKHRIGTRKGSKVFFERAAVIAWLERRMKRSQHTP